MDSEFRTSTLEVPIARSVEQANWRTRNLGALLFGATDRCVRDKLKVMQAGGFPMLSEAQLALFHHLDPAGMRLTTLAAQANLTKQSMIELVDRAAAMGFVERRLDLEDRRAKEVHLTADGMRVLASLRKAVTIAESGVAAVFGIAFFEEAKRTLARYADRSETLSTLQRSSSQADDAWRLSNIARLFSMSARRFSREALEVAHDHGWQRVTEVLLALFRNLDLDGSRLTDVAAKARMTKQSMRELVDRAESLGLVTRRPDPTDKRAKLIAFTTEGLQMLEVMRGGLLLAEDHFGEKAGPAFTAVLKDKLLDYATRSVS